jgi:hypothetical protein
VCLTEEVATALAHWVGFCVTTAVFHLKCMSKTCTCTHPHTE